MRNGHRSEIPAPARLTRRGLLGLAGGAVAAACGGLSAKGGEAPETPEQAERRRVEAAIPTEAFVRPRRPRKLLIFDLNVNYGGHASIRTANLAFTLMGRRTGAFETVVSRDPAVFRPASLGPFDAVFLNNTVGNLFEDAELRRNLVEFVYAGGGLMGVHGTTVAFTRWGKGGADDWPEFGVMLGGRGANHRANDEHVFLKLDDPGHPLNRPFGGKDFDYRSEFFRVHEPYSRRRVRVLLSIDTARTDMNQGPAYGKLVRADGDYALAWVRNYGRGRVFQCTIAHAPSVFWDPTLLRFYLAAAQFALGDLEAPTTPSAMLSPAVRAQEKLGWRLGLAASAAGEGTFFQAVDAAQRLGLCYLGALGSQTIDQDIPRPLAPGLAADDFRRIRLKLDSAGVRLVTLQVPRAPADQAGWRAWLQFARAIGAEALVAQPTAAELDAVRKLSDELDVRLVVRSVCAREPIDAPAGIKDHLIVIQPQDDAGKLAEALGPIRRIGVAPTMFAIEQPAGGPERESEAARCREFFDKAALEAAK